MDNIEKDIAQGYADFADDEGSTAIGTEENIALNFWNRRMRFIQCTET